MVKYNPRTWFALIFHSYGRSIMRVLAPVIAFVILFTSSVCYILVDVFEYHLYDFQTNYATHSLLGIVLGLFLVFRVNSAYERWWEGRKIWGQLVNTTRNLSMKYQAFLPSTEMISRVWFARMIPNVVASLRDHLRNEARVDVLDIADEGFLKRLSHVEHIPNILSLMMYEKTQSFYKNKILSNEHLFLIDKELKELSDIIGACERIKNTPIPYSYMMYLKQFIFIYIITLPFAFVTTAGYFTVPIVVIITFVLFSIELIAEEIEDPFGNDANDLPTDELTQKIKENVCEILIPDTK